jgi:hypothetical protein
MNKKRFYELMEDFDKKYKKKYGYSFDYPYTTSLKYISIDIKDILINVIRNLAIWYHHSNGYKTKPKFLHDEEHVIGYYCYVRYKKMLEKMGIFLKGIDVEKMIKELLEGEDWMEIYEHSSIYTGYERGDKWNPHEDTYDFLNK